MKLAEVDWIRSKTGQWPVLLLDEVLAELDPVRRADLLTRVLESEQAIDHHRFGDVLPKFCETSTGMAHSRRSNIKMMILFISSLL
jgi:recombinational DNA repair ATPase RecF